MEKSLPDKLFSHFHSLPQKIYTAHELGQIIADFAQAVLYHEVVSPEAYIDYLVYHGKISRIVMTGANSSAIRFSTGNFSRYELALSIKGGSYFSHGTAAYFQGLCDKTPTTVYLSVEGKPRETADQKLEQSSIDRVFDKPQRQSSNGYNWEGHDFLLMTGLFTKDKAIKTKSGLPVTGLEKTLLDCTVRPAYTGGAAIVMDLYRRAVAIGIDAQKLIAMYDEMHFIYPYHQAIGFYLERTGGESAVIESLRERPQSFTFYLDYAMQNRAYSPSWNLYYPAHLE
jgi:hypothetical protein